MPTEFASAIADLRLSPDKLPQDYAAAKRQLLSLTRQLEQQAAIKVSVSVDLQATQRELNRTISRLSAVGGLTLPVALDADVALDELAALQSVLDPLLLPVDALTDQATAEINALQARFDTDPIIIPVQIDDSAINASVDNVVQQTLPNTVNAFGQVGAESGREFAQRFTSITQAAIGGLSIALGGFLATSLVRGFQRLTTIQDATASLTVALGSATAAARTLDDVLNVVTGTPFNLDQFATAASNLISFGVEANKIPLYLEAIGEASATRGSRANEFAQRLADTFGQVSVQGRIMGEDILSLQATGVNALAILGNSFGKTTFEIREMISEGAVPADEALQILSDGILNGTTGVNGATVAFAGTMEKLRETLTGAIGGFQSATARLGAAIIKPFEGALTEGFNAASDIVNTFNTTITKALSGLGDSDGFQTFIDFIGDLPDKIDPLLETLQGLGPALAPLAAAFGATGLGQLQTLLGPLGSLIPTLNPIVAAIGAFIAFTPELRDELGPVLVDLGESFAILSAGLGQALGDALEEITPLLVQVAGAIGELSPTIQSLVLLTVGLADTFVPVLGAMADILDGFPLDILLGIAGAFLAFKGISALQSSLSGLTTRLSGFATGLTTVGENATLTDRTLANLAGRAGLTSERIAQGAQLMTTALNAAAIASAGFFSGFAANSEDATVAAAGFLGAATSIATGFAQGPVAGLATTAATIGGYLVSMWVDSKKAAEEYARDIETLAESIVEDLGIATAALLEARDLVQNDDFASQTLNLIGADQIQLLREYGVSLNDILSVAGDLGVSERLGGDLGRAIGSAIDEQGQIDVEGIIENFQGVVDKYAGTIDLSELIVPGDDIQTVENILAVQDALEIAEKAAIDTGAAVSDQIELQTSLQEVELERLRNSYNLTDQQIGTFLARMGNLGLTTADVIDKIGEGGDNIGALLQAAIPSDLPNAYDIILMGIDEVEEKYGYAINVMDDGTVEFIKNTDGISDGLDKAGGSAEDFAAAVDAAMKLAEISTDRFNESLEGMLDNLDAITEQQDYAAGFREIGATLSEIVNADDLKEVESLIDNIAKQRDGLFDLEGKLAEEQVKANVTAFELDAQIADAESKGAVKIAAALRNARAKVFDDVDKIGQDIADKKSEIADLESQVAAIGRQIPTTLAQLLQGQAQFLGVSLFDLLTSPNTTEEAAAFFQGSIVPQIQSLGGLIQRELEENPLLASVKIPSLVEGLIQGLVGQGVDAATARQLVEEALNPGELAAQATQVFTDSFNADITQLGGITAALLRGETIDPSIDVKAIVDDVTGGIAELTEAERNGIDIPTDVDLIAAQESLTAFNQAYESSDFTLVIPVEGDLTQIIDQITGLEEYSIQIQRKADAPDGLGPTFGNSAAGNSTSTPWWEGNFNRPRRRGGGGGTVRFLEDGGILQWFKDGGISENHIAQIASNNMIRAWAEPETGGEAYIPLHQSKRSRSTQILQTVADMFGLDVMPRGMGPLDSSMAEESMARAVERGVKSAGVPGPGARARAHDQAARSVTVEKIEVNGVTDPNRAARRVMRELSDVALGLHRWDD